MPAPDSFTKLLLHCNGLDGSNAFVDSSPTPKTIVPSGNVQMDTAQYKFGKSSALFDGNGDMLQCNSSDFNIVDGTAMAIDFLVRFNTLPTNGNFALLTCQAAYGVNEAYYISLFNNSGIYSLRFFKAGVLSISGAVTVSTGIWYHVAFTKATDNTCRLFFGGNQVGSDIILTGFNAYGYIKIGSYGYASADLDGWIDEYRFSQGNVRWTSAFIPPTMPYSYYTFSGYVKLNGTGIGGAIVKAVNEDDVTIPDIITTAVDGSFSMYVDKSTACHLVAEYTVSGIQYNTKSLWEVIPIV
jgi:hypothetical protein